METVMDETSQSRKSTPTPLAESLRDVETLMHKSGRYTPERQRQLDEQAKRLAEQDRTIKAQGLCRKSGVFPKYITADLQTLDVPETRLKPDEVARYRSARDQLAALSTIPGTVILRGENGPGKTHLASALVLHFCNQGREARYCRAVDFFMAIKSTFGAPGKTLEDLERRFRAYELLVLDEIEIRSESTWENNVLRSLIDARYASYKSTVLITNKSSDDVRGYFSAAILSRMSEAGSIIHCDWPSLRGST